jgi:hypothetical protein
MAFADKKRRKLHQVIGLYLLLICTCAASQETKLGCGGFASTFGPALNQTLRKKISCESFSCARASNFEGVSINFLIEFHQHVHVQLFKCFVAQQPAQKQKQLSHWVV